MQTTETQPCHGKREFLSFQLGGLEYGLEFRKVQELRVLKSLERFAADGEIIGGVAVSRGVIMPIVDMRAATGVRPAVPDPLTDVVALHNDQISPIAGAEGEDDVDYLIGLGEADGRRLILVDIDKLMSIKRMVAEGAQQAA